jgi:myo-inositol-1(or 4)-monophosphatase
LDDIRDVEEMVRRLSEAVRFSVRPMLGKAAAKAEAGRAATGDTTFGIDEVAERVVADFLDGVGDIAYYTEDRGLVVNGEPGYVLVIDPIDGTRPAAAGLESCCVSVAAAPFSVDDAGRSTLGDVFLGMVTEIKNDAVYTGVRGSGAWIERDGMPVKPVLSDKTELNRLFWTAGFRGRPAEPLVTVISELIDLTSVDGGCFDLGSATFCITRVLTGEMDAYVDVGQRMAQDVATVREMFLEVGHGALLNNYPYDLAAAVLIASEAGAVVTDAYGRPLDGYPLIPAGGGGQLSSMVAANPVLHSLLMDQVERGLDRLRARFGGSRAV